jgi:predicted nucleic acid-binding protein
VPLLVEEAVTESLCELYLQEEGIVVWWGTPVECASALARLEREERLSPRGTTRALQRLDQLARGWHRIEPVEPLQRLATRLLRVHPLRAADALQLAAALLASEGRPAALGFVCLDDRLTVSAQREGFAVLDRGGLPS